MQLTVVNIQNLADYAKVSRYLRSLTPVKQVQVSQIEPTSIGYDLHVSGGRFALQQALSLDHRLQQMETSTNTNMDTGLIYQWIS